MTQHTGDAAHIDAQVQEWVLAYSGHSIAVADLLCDRFADDGEKVALFYEDDEGREEVADQNRLPAVALKHLARLVQIRLVYEHEAAEPPDEPAQALLLDPEPWQVQD